MKGSLRIGRVAGIGVFIHWTFVLLIGYVIFSSARASQDVLWSVLFVLSIFVTVFLHELGHALAAKRYGIGTRDITLLPIGGVARLEKFPEKPGQELVVAIAGPAVNVLIALLTAIIIDFPSMREMDEFLSPGVNADNFLLNFFFVNIWLALFNLIPAFPMDGGRVLRAMLSFWLQRNVATRIAAVTGQAMAVLFIVGGFFFNPFLVIIGIFIFIGARSEADVVEKQFLLSGSSVEDAMLKEFPALDVGQQVDEAVRLLLGGQSKNFLITRNGEPAGTIGRDELIRALADGHSSGTLETVMNTGLVWLEGDQPLSDALATILASTVALMLIRKNGQMIGAIDKDNILEFIMVKGALQKQPARASLQ